MQFQKWLGFGAEDIHPKARPKTHWILCFLLRSTQLVARCNQSRLGISLNRCQKRLSFSFWWMFLHALSWRILSGSLLFGLLSTVLLRFSAYPSPTCRRTLALASALACKDLHSCEPIASEWIWFHRGTFFWRQHIEGEHTRERTFPCRGSQAAKTALSALFLLCRLEASTRVTWRFRSHGTCSCAFWVCASQDYAVRRTATILLKHVGVFCKCAEQSKFFSSLASSAALFFQLRCLDSRLALFRGETLTFL